MNRLPISKIAAILALPEGQREEVAVKAVEENQSLRELQAVIDAMRSDLEDSRKKVRRAERERNDALAVNERISRSRSDYYNEMCKLRKQVETLQAPSTGISAEAQAEIDALKKRLELEKGELAAKLADAEQMAEYQARQREQAQQELLDLRTQAARGEGPAQEDLTAETVGMAARTFIGTVGYVPHSDKLLTLREGDRAQIASYAVMLQRWAEDVLRVVDSARDVVVIEGV